VTKTIAPAARVADTAHGKGITGMPTATVVDRATSVTAVGHDPGRPVRLLVFTSLYPNSEQPRNGIFIEERLRRLVATGRVSATVVAPVPWFPFRNRRFGAYATYARVPEREERHGIHILHPRYPVIPKIGMNVGAGWMARAALPIMRELVDHGTFDLIDAHYFYPDGVAAARLGFVLRKPVVISARGSDVNVIARYKSPRRQMCWAAGRAVAIIAVSETLRQKIVALGVPSQKLTTLRNGVDLVMFRPLDRTAIRAALDLQGRTWLAVGNLVEPKGVHVAIAALAQVLEATLMVIGAGPERNALQRLAEQLGVAGRVRFIGTVAHGDLCAYYNAADALVLASSREGMPNVVLESLACGTPLIAAPFDSAAELVSTPDAGEIAESRTAQAVVAAWRRLECRRPERAATRRYAESLGWAPVLDAQCALYARMVQIDAQSRGGK
jgi:glycosyltransferase involved in cell wall biosynthesis